MIMTLPSDVEAWASDQVKTGRFATVEDAVSDAVRVRALLEDDFEWARPQIDEARAQVARGEVVGRSAVTQAMRGAIERHKRDA